jgi:flagellar biosynthesis protein FlhA
MPNPPSTVAPRRHALDWAVPIGILMAVMVVLAPVPAALLDILLAANLTLSVLALLGALAARTPLELSIFPTFLLGSTLVRLVLNVATTRLVLSRAAIDGADAAGEVVKAFGQFVAANDLVVGAVIFAIIAVIQFVVITAGSTRTSEVAARFTLDGLPGRQMAIDAEVQAGALTREEARAARLEIQRQADFFAAMDGASRFVRGEAVAGVIITAVNIVGGLALGVVQHGMPLRRAIDVYSRLTIGDGLVSAVPALFVSVATGLLISRSSQTVDLPQELGRQFFSRAHVLVITAAFLVALSLTGLPKVPLLAMAAALAVGAILLARRPHELPPRASDSPTAEAPGSPTIPVDEPIVVELGAGLLGLVAGSEAALVAAVRRMRADIGADLGMVVPQVAFRDNLSLPARGYRVTVAGDPAADGVLPEGRRLALPRAGEPLSLDGPEGIEPGGQRRGVWVGQALAETARKRGASVLDETACIRQALESSIRRHADKLLSREAVARLLESLRATQPSLVEQSTGDDLPLSKIHRALQLLVREGVPIRPLSEVLEILSDHAGPRAMPAQLAEEVRRERAATICRRARDMDGRLVVVRLAASALDSLLSDRVRDAGRIIAQVRRAVAPRIERGAPAVVVVPDPGRSAARDRLCRHLPMLHVLSDAETAGEEAMVVFVTVGEEEALRAA